MDGFNDEASVGILDEIAEGNDEEVTVGNSVG